MITTRSYNDTTYQALGRLIGAEGAAITRMLRHLRNPYETFSIPKGASGSVRSIEAPAEPLKALQRQILDHLLYRIPVSPDCHGFVPGRSIMTNAGQHLGQQVLINYDIAGAFPSTSRRRVLVTLERKLGHFLKHSGPRTNRKTREQLTELLADVATFDDHLPQGAPTSGAILNLCLAPLDRSIRRAIGSWFEAGHTDVRYSRYADDLTLSAGDGGLPPDAESVLRRAIHCAGYRFNASKIGRCDRGLGKPLIICGLYVDGTNIRLPRKTMRRYRAFLHHSFFPEELSAEARDKLHGIAGLVHMVYGTWPPQLGRHWRMVAAKHGLSEPLVADVDPAWSSYRSQ